MYRLNTKQKHALESLRMWLEDNVDQGTDICFDNEEEVKSPEALEALDIVMAPKHRELFIFNKNNHYLRVQGPIDSEKLAGCEVLPNVYKLWQRAAESQNLTVYEVQHTEYTVKLDGPNWWEYDDRGNGSPVDLEDGQTIEQYLSEWQL